MCKLKFIFLRLNEFSSSFDPSGLDGLSGFFPHFVSGKSVNLCVLYQILFKRIVITRNIVETSLNLLMTFQENFHNDCTVKLFHFVTSTVQI